ncbi:hypothetical protein NBRC3257_1100 [Gluconobacter thailandicus NBRC 3257]|uniref:Thiol-disulfide oxidoreductase n=1 Tax=Gluconobacter thailandicus NBRC 3257 TaxID=1381097 RepID=A0ABQ0IV78_GLUTH|nr:DUF393 domain-containing protein [Gluconobacter thailandicus]KXV52086.1 thiol-disulfide oxidoreductase [Gluconobacter thailandicus]GAC86540.1 hypothetical protein NBRC3255_0201 [Gluconobacter thailandicus NBRC 3255]GAD26101.1 hypothetical protein NBRC3257_1100 [Gluconobacter thailandicus NBRC 3257]
MTRLTVWHDGSCPLCQKEIALMRRLDRRGNIQFIDATSETADCPLDRRKLLGRFHAREGDRMYDGAAAFAAMWRAILVLRPLGEIARFPPVLKGLEFLYGHFLKARPVLQRIVRKIER